MLLPAPSADHPTHCGRAPRVPGSECPLSPESERLLATRMPGADRCAALRRRRLSTRATSVRRTPSFERAARARRPQKSAGLRAAGAPRTAWGRAPKLGPTRKGAVEARTSAAALRVGRGPAVISCRGPRNRSLRAPPLRASAPRRNHSKLSDRASGSPAPHPDSPPRRRRAALPL